MVLTYENTFEGQDKKQTMSESYKKYREDPGLNQSFLKQVLDNNVRNIKPTKRMLEGTGIDCLLYTPEEFYERYEVFEDVPTGALKEEIEKCVLEWDTWNVNDIFDALKRREYQNNWTDTTLKKNIEKHEDYANTILGGKTPISSKDYFRYGEAVSAIKKSEVWSRIYTGYNEYQKDLYADYMYHDDPIRCKGLLDDLCIIDNTAIITDCKFTSAVNLDEWMSIARNFKYPMQMAFYKMLVEGNYDIKYVYCQWLVYFAYTKQVKLIQVHPFDLEVGKSGARVIKEEWYNHKNTFKNESMVRGYEDAIAIYCQAMELGIDHFDIEAYYNKGFISSQSIYFQ